MKIRQFIKTASLILLLSFTTLESAQAGISFSGAARGGSSSAFKSGFSSHKYSVPSRTSDPVAAKSTSFGTFGVAGHAEGSPAATANTKSALSKDLNATSANAAALKTFDARNQPAAPTAPAGSSHYTAGNGAPAGYVNPPAYVPSPMPQTVVVQRDSGFSSSPFLWFMLGHSMASQGRDRVIYERPVYTNGAVVGDPAVGGNPAPVVAMQEPQESFGAKLLRVVLWLTILATLVAGVLWLLAKRAARTATANTHYSLGKI